MGRQDRKEERKHKRKGISLKKSLISKQLLKRYQMVLVQIVEFLTNCHLQIQAIEDLDEAMQLLGGAHFLRG